jgi:hypothetical protein
VSAFWELSGGIFTPIFHQKQNRLFQTLDTFFGCLPLPVGLRHFRAESNIPFTVAVYFRRQLQVHAEGKIPYAVRMAFFHHSLLPISGCAGSLQTTVH